MDPLNDGRSGGFDMRETEAARPAMWTARPWVARSIRALVYLLPLAMSIAAAWILSDVVPQATSFAVGVARWVAIAAASTIVLIGVDKVARRLLPLATLFGLTLAFPDQAPSRFRLALRTGSTAQLKRRIAEARSGRPVDTPAVAAERVLELVIALNTHDRLTRGHSERVRAYTQMIGEEMGLTDVELDRLRWSGLLHDIGKLKISSAILNKPGKLTQEEFEEIKLHPEHGRQLVEPLIGWLGESARAVWEHHERWDGRGYPHGLSGTDISLAGRIVSVADTYDVITSVRSYKTAVSPAEARAELTRCAGTQFDPAVVRAFMNLSLGRLRIAMGPLSWLAQVPLFPQAIATTAATGTAGAATALVGAAAASMGLGLAGDHLVPKDRVALAEAVSTSAPDHEAGRLAFERRIPVDSGDGTGATEPTGPTSPNPAGPVPPIDPGGASAGETDSPAAPGADPTPIDTSSGGSQPPPATSTTTAAPAGSPVTTIATPSVTSTTAVPPRPADTTSTTSPRSPGSTTTRPTLLPTLPVTLPTLPVTLPVTLPTLPITLPVTLPPILTNPPTTTTMAPRPGWLPPAGVASPLYLDVPATVDVAAAPILPLVREAPTALAVTDADGDGRSGITLTRTPPAQLTFAFDAPLEARIQGPASGTVYASTPALLASTATVRARLMTCDSAGECTTVAERTGSVLVTVVSLLAITFDFGTIDVTIPAGGSLRVVLDVPPGAPADVLLSVDALLNPANVTVVFR